MIDSFTLDQCKKDQLMLDLKIKNLEHAVKQSEEMIAESKMEGDALTFLRKKVAESNQDLELLYFLKNNH